MVTIQENGHGLELKVENEIRSGRIPSFSDIENDFGDFPKDKIYLALASTFGQRRKSGGPEALHLINAMTRASSRNLFDHSPEVSNLIVIHDQGENMGGFTLAGAFSINRVMGEIFGGDYEVAGNLLTNYRAIVIRNLVKKGERYIGKPIEKLSQDDYLDALSKMRDEVLGYRNRAHQKAVEEWMHVVGDFERSVKDSGIKLPGQEKGIIRDYVHEWTRAAKTVLDSPPSELDVKGQTDRFVEDLIGLLRGGPLELDEDCKFIDGDVRYSLLDDHESEVLHIIRKRGYGGYLQDISDWVLSGTYSPYSFDRLELLIAKLADQTDNIRIQPIKNVSKQHAQYSKSRMVVKTFETCIEGYVPRTVRGTETIPIAGKSLEFLRGQFLLRILTDYSQNLLDSDTTVNTEHWFRDQFMSVVSLVGGDSYRRFEEALLQAPHRLGLTHAKAANLYPNLVGLMVDRNMHSPLYPLNDHGEKR